MANPVFLGIGECMVELSEAENGLLRRSFAGDVFNTLWYARQAMDDGWTTRFFSAIGTDPLSDQMLTFIRAARIDTGTMRRIPERRPGLYMIHLDDGERSFSYWRDSSAARLLANDPAHLRRVIDDADVIYFSGITLAILPHEDREAMLLCLSAAKNDGKVVAFDPNIRPALWDDPVRMRRVIERAAHASTIILPSFDDERAAFGDAVVNDTLARYASGAPALIVVKDGAAAVTVQGEDGERRIFDTTPITKPVDTTGAGDSFNGAFLAAYVASSDIAEAVAAGQACAARVIGHHGALIDRPIL